MKGWVPAAFIGTACCLTAGQSGAHTFSVAGRVAGSSGKCTVYVALWQARDFLKRPAQEVRIQTGAEAVFQFEVQAGRYAISAFEDCNGNGVLDLGLFGPKEPNGFWRPFVGHHKPRFDEVASTVEADVPNADIRIK